MGVVRAFISIHLPAETRAALTASAVRLREAFPRAKWERTDKLHLTLRFLGDTGEERIPPVLDALRDAARETRPFTLTVEGFGAFPSERRPRILWAGCRDDDGSLQRLRGALDDRLQALGVGREERAFHPHITLARLGDDGAAHRLPAGWALPAPGVHRVSVADVFLMKSVLRPAGAEHTVIGSAGLG